MVDGRVQFKFSKDQLEGTEPTSGAPESGSKLYPSNLREGDLGKVGVTFATQQFPNKYQWSRMGGWNVAFRASICRIAFMKLFGTGVAAFLMAINPSTGRYTSFSCAMSAAVNALACFHYWFIWSIRAQTYGNDKYDRWRARVGRASGEDESLLQEEKEHDERVIYWQEVQCDGLRYSDWLCTLVLMTLDLGHLREYMHIASSGVVPELSTSKEWLASYQALMILFATAWRFYFNEGRMVPTDSSRSEFKRPMCTAIMALLSFVGSMVFFVLVCIGLLEGLPSTDAVSNDSLKTDIVALQVLVLVWIGYPIVAVLASAAHFNVPGDQYYATWSLIKDLSFSFLDVTAKGGLAIYFVLKATWIDGDAELALISSANNTGA